MNRFDGLVLMAVLVWLPRTAWGQEMMSSALKMGGGAISGVRVTGEGVIEVAPDPGSILGLAVLLRDENVRKFLELTDIQDKVCKDLQSAFGKRWMSIVDGFHEQGVYIVPDQARKDYAALCTSELEELLIPRQVALLKQLAYRLEITRMGYADSLTVGMLSRSIGVYDNQKDLLFRVAQSVEERTEKKIAEIRREAEEEILELLVPEQRKQAIALLGDTIEFTEPTVHQSRYRETKKKLNLAKH